MTGWSNGGVTGRRPTVQRIDDPDEEAPDVRLAEQRDVPRIAATLTVALADSRWTRWALPDDGRMQRLTRLHELDAAHRGVSTKTAWVTDDVDAVAVWEPPPGAEGTAPLPADVVLSASQRTSTGASTAAANPLRRAEGRTPRCASHQCGSAGRAPSIRAAVSRTAVQRSAAR